MGLGTLPGRGDKAKPYKFYVRGYIGILGGCLLQLWDLSDVEVGRGEFKVG